MTLEELEKNYPKTFASFDDWFRREGWGASNATELSEWGFKEWFPDFLRDYNIDSIASYESELD